MANNSGGGSPALPMGQQGLSSRPRAMTVEELERELVGSARRGSGDGLPVGYPPPPLSHSQPGQVQILKRVPSPPQSGLPLPIGTPPRQHFLQQHPSQVSVAKPPAFNDVLRS